MSEFTMKFANFKAKTSTKINVKQSRSNLYANEGKNNKIQKKFFRLFFFFED